MFFNSQSVLPHLFPLTLHISFIGLPLDYGKVIEDQPSITAATAIWVKEALLVKIFYQKSGSGNQMDDWFLLTL